MIYADPPWNWQARSHKGEGGAAKAHYDTMSVDDIIKIFNPQWADDDCVLLLWSLTSMPLAAHEVIRGWGFEYRTVAFTWAKRTPLDKAWHFGLGYCVAYWPCAGARSACRAACRSWWSSHVRSWPQAARDHLSADRGAVAGAVFGAVLLEFAAAGPARLVQKCGAGPRAAPSTSPRDGNGHSPSHPQVPRSACSPGNPLPEVAWAHPASSPHQRGAHI